MAAGDTVRSGNFTFTETSIEGVIVVDVESFGDSRGYFMETYKHADFVAGGIDAVFVQDNQSSSVKGVLRGLPSWCVSYRARSSTSLSILGLIVPLTVDGKGS